MNIQLEKDAFMPARAHPEDAGPAEVEVLELSSTARGSGGFGSTGK